MLRWAIHPRLHEVQFLTPPTRQPRTNLLETASKSTENTYMHGQVQIVKDVKKH
jgi:hypothetical protein